MKIVRLMGGLGNQMFQYAFGQALGKDVLYDLSWFEEIKNTNQGKVAKRVYELDCFDINPKFASDEERKICINEVKIRNSRLPKFLCKFLKKNKWNITSNKVFEPSGTFAPQLLELGDNAFVEGYFQCEKYFLNLRPQLLKKFSLKFPINEKNQKMLEQIKEKNAVSLHVRRGDYVNLQKTHGLCSLDYYKRAIEYIANNTKNPHFFMFSDDIDWVKANLLIEYPYTVVDINSANEGCLDIELMKNCKHNIIANSSFSWWGAWLNQNPDKIIIAPEKVNANVTTKDFVPDNWIRI